jgi:hypothetical protein
MERCEKGVVVFFCCFRTMIPVCAPRVRAIFLRVLRHGEVVVNDSFARLGKERCSEAHSTRLTLFSMPQYSNETNTRLTLCGTTNLRRGELWLPTKHAFFVPAP